MYSWLTLLFEFYMDDNFFCLGLILSPSHAASSPRVHDHGSSQVLGERSHERYICHQTHRVAERRGMRARTVSWETSGWAENNKNREKVYSARGENVVTVVTETMHPSEFLGRVPSPISFTRSSLDHIKDRIEDSKPIEAPWIEYRGTEQIGHEGRHRAKALIDLGITNMPVDIIQLT